MSASATSLRANSRRPPRGVVPGATRAGRATVPRLHPGGTDGPGRVVVIGATVGQGHDGAARELARRLAAAGVDVTVHDYLDALPTVAKRVLRDCYAPTVQYLPGVFEGLFRRLEPPGALRVLAARTSGSS